ncbi:MAG: iron complex transport system permease protein [Lentimonas sp.]|jgi:iron complex transport system permease protein
MNLSKKHIGLLIIVFLAIPFAFFLHFSSGEISISWDTFWVSVFNYSPNDTSHIIIHEFRIPRFSMACLAGGALALSGLMMQTLFNNPLAGPYVLGINAGSSLLVALALLSGFSFFKSDLGVISSALIGALLFGAVILALSQYVKNGISLLLVGLMIGSFSGALVSILQAMSEAQSLKIFTLWSMGSLQQVQSDQLGIILLFFALGTTMAFLLIKPLNAMVLGESSASQLGISIKKVRTVIILATAILTGLITAFCGPIAFIGLAVPNLVKIIFKTQNHGILIPACLASGAIFLVICDIIVQLMVSTVNLPINAITSLIGAPMIIYFVLKKLA